jgi:hypothetical protein
MGIRRLNSLFAVFLMATFLGGCAKRGHLATNGLDNQPTKAILYFAGEQLDGKTLPQNVCTPPVNITPQCETAWPVEQDLLDWIQPANRLKAVREVAQLGFNTITMSTWGESCLPCTVACPYIPRQCCGQKISPCPNQIYRCSMGSELTCELKIRRC